MKTISLVFFMFSMGCLCAVASAQSRLAVGVVGGESVNSIRNGEILSHWGNGWTIDGSLSYHVMATMDVDLNLSYDQYPYKGGNFEITLPVSASATFSGKPSTAEEASLGVRFTAPTPFAKPFVVVKAGLRNLSIGRIDIAESTIGFPQDVSHQTYSGTGASSVDFFAAVGFGFLVPINSMFSVSIEGRFSRVFLPNETYVPLVAGAQLNL